MNKTDSEGKAAFARDHKLAAIKEAMDIADNAPDLESKAIVALAVIEKYFKLVRK